MRIKCVLAVVALLLQVSAASAAVCGDAYYNHGIDWPNTPSLYYTVTGAPPNTCGDLWASRNGNAYQKGAGWICTDSSGNATKGPWSSNPIDETAYVYIDWGSCTSPVRTHIWDVTEATVNITSSVPGAFAGTATDATWGAGFNSSWTQCQASYQFNTGTGIRYWSSLTGGYTSSSSVFAPCSISGMPSMSVTWSTTSAQRPPLGIHVPGGYYTWTVWVYDGGQWVGRSISFTF